ncbi:MAG: YggT family protein [bacterium]|nr:YggT family protein [bacterium]
MEETKQTEEVTTVSTAAPQQVVKTTTKVTPPPVKTEPPQQVFEKKKTIFRTYQIIWYILAVIEVLLGFRMVLKALGANPTSGFTTLVYALSNPLAMPFSGILPVSISGNSIFEWSTIIAALVYLLIAFGLVHLMQMIKPVTPNEVEQKVDNP